jgi:fatty-acyl-CoA synthase
MVFSAENKRKFLEYCPHLIIADVVGSSETPRTAMSIVSERSDVEKACESLQLFPGAKVFTEDFEEVLPGNGQKGFLAVSGTLPLGYYKDAKKTAETFFLIDGVRYSRPGDWVEVLEDGKVKFLGRGNVSINTGAEKVYPDEVESVIKSYPGIEDCLVVGVPDARWGQAITAVVERSTGCLIDPEQIKNHVRTRIADYKVPKHVLFVEKLYRSPSGKADYPAVQKFALAAVAERDDCAI